MPLMATKKEREHMEKVAEAGCLVCRIWYGVYTPAGIHHCGTHMGGGRDHMKVIPLCGWHHQTGGEGNALHANRYRFTLNFGTEEELLRLQEEQDRDG